MTVSWKVKRSEFVDPLFYHKNNCFEKKVKVSAGSGPTKLNLNVNFKLFPNGINWDQDSYSTLKIEVTSPSSQTLSSDVYLQLVVTGADCQTGDVITSRQAEWPLHDKAHIIKEFIAHEVIKVSSARYFEFKATLRVKYSLSKDWVVVNWINLHLNWLYSVAQCAYSYYQCVLWWEYTPSTVASYLNMFDIWCLSTCYLQYQ